MFDEFAEQKLQTQEENLEETPRKPSTNKYHVPDFPELKCSLHKSPVRLVCTKQDCCLGIFLCSKCVISEHEHIKNCNPFIVDYEEFLLYIHKSSGLQVKPSEQSLEIMKMKKQNISHFYDHIKQEQYNISQIVSNLNELYQHKCSELTKSLQEQLEDQKYIFQSHYNKLEEEVQADKERDCEMPKFHEIKDRVNQMKDLSDIEQYMKNILRKKQYWAKASTQLSGVSIMYIILTENMSHHMTKSQANN